MRDHDIPGQEFNSGVVERSPKQALETALSAWYQDTVGQHAARASSESMVAIETAVDELPLALAGVSPGDSASAAIDQWFAEHFKKPPVSLDTELYNAIFSAAETLKQQLADSSKS